MISSLVGLLVSKGRLASAGVMLYFITWVCNVTSLAQNKSYFQ